MRVLALLLGVTVFASVACPAAARDDEDDCQSETAPPGQIIAACTRLLAGGLSADDRHGAFYNRALALQAEHHERAAIADYSAAIGLNAKDSDSYANRGSCYQHLGQNQLAIADFDRALRLNPDDDIAHLDRAAVLLRLHYDARALDDLNAAVRLRPNDGEVYATRAATYEALGNDAASIDDTTRALDLHADDADTLRFHRGLMEFHLRRLDEAQADFKQLVDEQPVSDLTGAAAAWLHASDHRLGLDDSSHPLVRASQLGSQWPAPLLRYLAGRVSREELLGAAHSGEQRCEAHMGIGMVEIAAHTGRDAQELAALRNCAPQPPDRRRPSGVPDEDGW